MMWVDPLLELEGRRSRLGPLWSVRGGEARGETWAWSYLEIGKEA